MTSVIILLYQHENMLHFDETMSGSSLAPAVCRKVKVLFTFLVFASV